MEQELEVRLKADGSGLVGEVRASSDELDKLGKSVERSQGSAEKYNAQQLELLKTIRSQTQGTSDLTKRQIEAAAALDKLRSSIDPAFSSTLSLSNGQEILARNLKLGVISQQEHGELLQKLSGRYAGAANDVSFLTQRARALFDELSAGRTRQAFGTMSLLLTHLFDLGPAGLAGLVGIAALAAGLGYLAYQGTQTERALNQIEVGFIAMGRTGLIQRDQLKNTIDQLALLPNVSRASAQETIAALAAVPTIGGRMFLQLTTIVNDFAAATGKKVPDAAKELAKAFADPLKGAKTLDEQMNILTASEMRHIETLARQGRSLEAQQELFDATAGRVKGLAEQNLTTWDRMIKSIEDSWRSMNERMEREHERTSGRVGLPQTFQNSLRSQENAIARETALRIEIETQAALEASNAYQTWYEKMKQLRDERLRLETALSNATNAGDRSLLRGRIRGVNETIAGLDPALRSFNEGLARRQQEESETDIAQSQFLNNRQNQRQQFIRDTELARAGAIMDPNARARAQFDIEVRAREEAVSRDKALQEEFDTWLVARQALLNEQLKPQYQKNLDAWADTNRSMREFHDTTMLAVQQSADQAFRQMAVTGKFSAKAIGDAFKAELGSLVFKRLFAAPLAAGIDWLFGGGGAGGAGQAAAAQAATAATQALATAEGGAAASATLFDEAALTAAFSTDDLSISVDLMIASAETAIVALDALALSAGTAAAAQGAEGLGLLALLAHEGGTVGSGNIPTRRAPASLFANAPRFHSGLGADEFPAILQLGETVTPRGAAAGGMSVHASVSFAIDARGADAGVETRIKAVLQDQLPGALYKHRRALQGILEDERRRRGRA